MVSRWFLDFCGLSKAFTAALGHSAGLAPVKRRQMTIDTNPVTIIDCNTVSLLVKIKCCFITYYDTCITSLKQKNTNKIIRHIGHVAKETMVNIAPKTTKQE